MSWVNGAAERARRVGRNRQGLARLGTEERTSRWLELDIRIDGDTVYAMDLAATEASSPASTATMARFLTSERFVEAGEAFEQVMAADLGVFEAFLEMGRSMVSATAAAAALLNSELGQLSRAAGQAAREQDRRRAEFEARYGLGPLDNEANERAEALLCQCLSPAQLEQFDRDRTFTVHSQKGNEYRIGRGTNYNVILIQDGQKIATLCAGPQGVPWGDYVLAQKLWLENDEDGFLRVANVNPLQLMTTPLFTVSSGFLRVANVNPLQPRNSRLAELRHGVEERLGQWSITE